MPLDRANVRLFHITEISNLASIIQSGNLLSDRAVYAVAHAVIGYDHIKLRRLNEIRIPCRGNRFVGEFVPFYFCPRSPMLYTINRGNTGKPAGHQREIVHLVTRVATVVGHTNDWAISDGNAGALGGVSFFNELDRLDGLDWDAIHAQQWAGRTRQKMAEFLVANACPWQLIEHIGCYNQDALDRVRGVLGASTLPTPAIEPRWYY